MGSSIGISRTRYRRLSNRLLFSAFLLVLGGLIGIANHGLAESVAVDSGGKWLRLTEQNPKAPKPKMILYTTMATWCVACRTELPQFRHLRSVFTPEELGMLGLPYDEKEGSNRLKEWATSNRPPYELLAELPKDKIALVKKMVINTLRFDGVPTTIITDGTGHVLRMRWGPPSVSELRELQMSLNK